MNGPEIGFDFCGAGTFAVMIGVSVDKVRNWLELGMIPSVRVGGVQMVNLQNLQLELLKGKDGFTEGDYPVA